MYIYILIYIYTYLYIHTCSMKRRIFWRHCQCKWREELVFARVTNSWILVYRQWNKCVGLRRKNCASSLGRRYMYICMYVYEHVVYEDQRFQSVWRCGSYVCVYVCMVVCKQMAAFFCAIQTQTKHSAWLLERWPASYDECQVPENSSSYIDHTVHEKYSRGT
jgi:hypothetical protein